MKKFLELLPPPLALFIRLSRPFFLFGGFLLYALGAAIARYLGNPLDLTAYWLGQGCVTMMQLSAHYLNEYFDTEADQENPNRTFFSGGSGINELPKRISMLAAMACLTVGAVLTVLLYRGHYLNGASILVLGLAFLGSFFYSTPPLRLTATGYGELTTSILVANLVPTFAFLLQVGQVHRLLAMVTLPLTFLHVAMLMAFSLPDYATDLKFNKKTAMVRLGWQRGMNLHNILIPGAYILMVLAVFQGLPLRLAWPGFLTLPLGIYQIRHMNQIAAGDKPRWPLLTFMAIAIFGMTAYFLTLAFWTG